MFSVVSKTLFVVVLVCAFLSYYEANGEDSVEGTTPSADTSVSGATGSFDATGPTATPDSSAGTASPSDTSSTSPSKSIADDIVEAAKGAESARRK